MIDLNGVWPRERPVIGAKSANSANQMWKVMEDAVEECTPSG